MQNLPAKRIASIDILRGLIMIIMALDHVRDFFHVAAVTGDPLDLKTTTPLLFFTRWITHFCAPVFVFLSGISAYLASRKKSRGETGSFLIRRGLWLVLAEVVLISLALTFNPLYNFVILEVIWAIGLSMVFLGLFLFISPRIILPAGLLLVFGHNMFDYYSLPGDGALKFFEKFLISSGPFVVPLGKTHFIGFFYTVLPWTGLMFTGYGIGKWFTLAEEKRRSNLLIAGAVSVLLFVIIRSVNQYGNPQPWSSQKETLFTVLSFLNTSKYPPSLDFSLMTIGPALLLLAFFESQKNQLTRICAVYGKVPFFYFVTHLYLAHFVLVIAFFASGYGAADIIPKRGISLFRPDEFGYPLWIVYLIWLSVVAALYAPCKWFAGVKQRNRGKAWVHYF
ncbi:MAG: DUF1624 domain-containing protein [Mucilaginibacter polytrichastri]|nr:DUF1624 domain-containing protein [Mucilaginibacter polytrichastri]